MIKDSFLKDAKIGAVVELIVGPKSLVGTVISLDINKVVLKKEDGGEANISLDNISYYEFKGVNIPKVIKAELVSDIASKEPNAKSKVGQEEEKKYSTKTINSFNSQPFTFDFNSIESRGLVFETNYWENDISSLKITPAINEIVKTVDSSDELQNGLSAVINQLANCAKS